MKLREMELLNNPLSEDPVVDLKDLIYSIKNVLNFIGIPIVDQDPMPSQGKIEKMRKSKIKPLYNYNANVF